VLAILALLLAGFAQGVSTMLEMPDVLIAQSDGKCVRVVDYKAVDQGRTSEWSCARLPPKYSKVIVRRRGDP
jgi:hypothetical protein